MAVVSPHTLYIHWKTYNAECTLYTSSTYLTTHHRSSVCPKCAQHYCLRRPYSLHTHAMNPPFCKELLISIFEIEANSVLLNACSVLRYCWASFDLSRQCLCVENMNRKIFLTVSRGNWQTWYLHCTCTCTCEICSVCVHIYILHVLIPGVDCVWTLCEIWGSALNLVHN